MLEGKAGNEGGLLLSLLLGWLPRCYFPSGKKPMDSFKIPGRLFLLESHTMCEELGLPWCFQLSFFIWQPL